MKYRTYHTNFRYFVAKPWYSLIINKVGRECIQVADLISAFTEMLTKPVVTTANNANCAGYARSGLGRETPFARGCSILAVEDYGRPSITAEHQRAHGKQDRLVASVLSIQCYAALGLGASVVLAQ